MSLVNIRFTRLIFCIMADLIVIKKGYKRSPKYIMCIPAKIKINPTKTECFSSNIISKNSAVDKL